MREIRNQRRKINLCDGMGWKMKWEIRMTSCPVSLCGAILCVVSCLFKMALCQYPCPEEIDVFTGPHMRMKQLVYETLEKVRSLYLRELLMGSFCAGTHPQALQRISLQLDSTSQFAAQTKGFVFKFYKVITSRS